MKYYIKTFGCQMNFSDSERISGFLETMGYKSAKNLSEASLVVFNTCGVRQMAEDRVYGQIHNIRKNEAKYPKLIPKIIVLTGCLANRIDAQKRLKDKVDLFFPISNFKKFEKWIIEKYLKIKKSKIKNITQKNNLSNNYFSIKPKYSNTYQSLVPIMTGCENFCAYCVVPHARGKEISRSDEEILKEIKSLLKKGSKKIILLGQNVNSYKFKTQKNKFVNFPQLLRKINNLHGNFWISFVSNHPKDVTDEMIETVASCQKVCENFHLPLQAGNDDILQKMNRKYTTKQYLKLIKKIKAAYKKYKPKKLYSITSDIIVGFPGETRAKFMDSAEIMKKVDYDMVYFGQYSPRPGTAAWKMKDNVSKKEKKYREEYLNEILKKTSLKNNKKYVGKIFDVLVVKKLSLISRNNQKSSQKTIYIGKTRTLKNVKFESKVKNLIGQFVKIKVTKANVWNLKGELLYE